MKRKTKLTPIQKEAKFVKIGTTLLLILVITFAFIYAFKNTFGGLDLGDVEDTTNTLAKLNETVDTDKFILDCINDDDKNSLVEKIKSAELDILTDDENNLPSYEKFNQNTISITNSISLKDNELGLLYSYISSHHSDKYNIILYQYSIEKTSSGYILYTVASIDFYALYTSKMKTAYPEETLNSFPRRVYIINTTTYSNGNFSYSKSLFNNLTEDESSTVSNIIKAVNSVELDKYVPNLMIDFVNTLSSKTSTTVEYNTNLITFNI